MSRMKKLVVGVVIGSIVVVIIMFFVILYLGWEFK